MPTLHFVQAFAPLAEYSPAGQAIGCGLFGSDPDIKDADGHLYPAVHGVQ